MISGPKSYYGPRPPVQMLLRPTPLMKTMSTWAWAFFKEILKRISKKINGPEETSEIFKEDKLKILTKTKLSLIFSFKKSMLFFKPLSLANEWIISKALNGKSLAKILNYLKMQMDPGNVKGEDSQVSYKEPPLCHIAGGSTSIFLLYNFVTFGASTSSMSCIAGRAVCALF